MAVGLCAGFGLGGVWRVGDWGSGIQGEERDEGVGGWNFFLISIVFRS